jgi:pimeloyl-ACP methyl ester carboxylesterase
MATFGLVHGAWHGAWCWELLSPELEKLGHRAVAVDLPCEDWNAGLDDNAATVATALADAEGDVVLVGHSLGGITIPVVTTRLAVAQFVFLCALVPEPGRSLDETIRVGRPRAGRGWTGPPVVHPDGSASWEPEAAVAAFYHDCPDDVAHWAASNLRRQVWTTTREPCPLERWPDVPSSYILCTEDKPIAPDWARQVARGRLGVEAIELAGGHAPMLSRPRQLAEVLDHLAGDG